MCTVVPTLQSITALVRLESAKQNARTQETRNAENAQARLQVEFASLRIDRYSSSFFHSLLITALLPARHGGTAVQSSKKAVFRACGACGPIRSISLDFATLAAPRRHRHRAWPFVGLLVTFRHTVCSMRAVHYTRFAEASKLCDDETAWSTRLYRLCRALFAVFGNSSRESWLHVLNKPFTARLLLRPRRAKRGAAEDPVVKAPAPPPRCRTSSPSRAASSEQQTEGRRRILSPPCRIYRRQSAGRAFYPGADLFVVAGRGRGGRRRPTLHIQGAGQWAYTVGAPPAWRPCPDGGGLFSPQLPSSASPSSPSRPSGPSRSAPAGGTRRRRGGGSEESNGSGVGACHRRAQDGGGPGGPPPIRAASAPGSERDARRDAMAPRGPA